MTDEEPTEAAVIRALGTEITFLDGSTARLRYDFDALAELEKEFGSLEGVSKAIDGVFGDEPEKLSGPTFTLVRKLMAIGLMGEELSPRELNQLLDPARYAEYFLAYAKSYAQALGAEATPKGKGKPRARRSPGKPSTTSLPLSLAEPISSSGA